LISVTGRRLHNQHLSGAGFTTPVDVVGWLGAVQGESRRTMVKPPTGAEGWEQRSPPSKVLIHQRRAAFRCDVSDKPFLTFAEPGFWARLDSMTETRPA